MRHSCFKLFFALASVVICCVINTSVASAEANDGADNDAQKRDYPSWFSKHDADPPSSRDMTTSVSQWTRGKLVCRHERSCSHFSDVLLVIKLNPVRLLWLDLLLTFYSAGFPHIAFFSTLKKGDLSKGKYFRLGRYHTTVHLIDDNYGFCDHQTVAHAMSWWGAAQESRFTRGGFLFLSDDVLLEFWKLTLFPKSTIWRQRVSMKSADQMSSRERDAVDQLLRAMPHLTKNTEIKKMKFPFSPTSGVYYVPWILSKSFREASRIMMKFRTYNEWGTPLVLTASSIPDEAPYAPRFVELKGKLVWGKKRFSNVKTLAQKSMLWYHPIRATSETFARVVKWVNEQSDLTPDVEIDPEKLYMGSCFICATHPSRLLLKKGLYHSCRAARNASACEDLVTTTSGITLHDGYTERVAKNNHLVLPTTKFVGGKVVVPRNRVGVENPFELDHEGFWGKEITDYIYKKWYSEVNSSRFESPLFGPFPSCCQE